MHKLAVSPHRSALIQARARGLRSSSTVSEQKLWLALSAGQLGVSFRRQVPVAHGFIVDFLAPSLKLVVEVDGGAHEHKRRADARRDEKLRRLGYSVLRVEAKLVLSDLRAAVSLVVAEVETLSERRGNGA